MKLKEKLQQLKKISGLTQTELAVRLGVTFAAFNRWVNNKAVPRKKTRDKIDELYKDYSGEKQIPETALEANKNLVLQKRDFHKNITKEIMDNPDIKDQFYLSLTFNSNRIEGSTLSENETAAILFQNAALPDKSLTEQIEAKNHQTALKYLFEYVANNKLLNEDMILRLHGILMNTIRSDAGFYRQHGVRIMGTYVPTANHLKIPVLMKSLIRDMNKKTGDIIKNITDTHSRFEKIHPFSDGNGRTGRLILHAMALKNNLAPAVILQEQKQFYIAYLNKAQMKDDSSLLENFICDAMLEGYRIIERKK